MHVVELQLDGVRRLPAQRAAGKPLIGRVGIFFLGRDDRPAGENTRDARRRRRQQSRALPLEQVDVVDESAVVLAAAVDPQGKMTGERNVEVALKIPVEVIEGAGVIGIAGGALDFTGEAVEFRRIGDDPDGPGL